MWTDERVTTLKKLWVDGLSARQIAKQLGGVTRNAVIGKIHRLGLSGRATPSLPRARPVREPRPARPRSTTRVVAPLRPRLVPVESAPEPEGPGLIKDTLQLRAHVCRWPIGDPQDPSFSFCGVAAEGEGPYCHLHRGRAYQLDKAKPLARDPYVRRLLRGQAA